MMGKILAYVLFLFALVACDTTYVDVSDEKEFSSMVGSRYRVLQPMIIHGVTMSQNYGNEIDVYIVSEFPGFDGPEVLLSRTLYPGVELMVDRVSKCKRCMFEKLRVEIRIVGFTTLIKAPIYLEGFSDRGESNVLVLDARYFEQKN